MHCTAANTHTCMLQGPLLLPLSAPTLNDVAAHTVHMVLLPHDPVTVSWGTVAAQIRILSEHESFPAQGGKQTQNKTYRSPMPLHAFCKFAQTFAKTHNLWDTSPLPSHGLVRCLCCVLPSHCYSCRVLVIGVSCERVVHWRWSPDSMRLCKADSCPLHPCPNNALVWTAMACTAQMSVKTFWGAGWGMGTLTGSALMYPPPFATPKKTVPSLFCDAISIALVCVPQLSHTRCCLAFPSLQISHLCIFCDILSPKAVYSLFQTQDVFSP